jgi:hypothetical protein
MPVGGDIDDDVTVAEAQWLNVSTIAESLRSSSGPREPQDAGMGRAVHVPAGTGSHGRFVHGARGNSRPPSW